MGDVNRAQGSAGAAERDRLVQLDALRDVLHDYVDRLWNQRDLSAIDDHVHPAYRMGPALHRRANRLLGRELPGDRASLRELAAMELGLFRQYRVRITRSVVEPPLAFWAHAATGMLASPGSRQVRHGGACLYRFRGERIIELDGVADVLEFLRQVGVDGLPSVPGVPI